jgi:type II secretory pathway pseudopilin PulG
VAITILNIMVAVALPLWSYTIRREREEETIFRGLQYAEAIRVFRQRNGRYPASLEELVKIEPRSIRQLWNEPLSEDGEFGLLVEAPPQPPAQPGQPGQPAAPGVTPTPGLVQQPNVNPGSLGGFGVGGSAGGAMNLVKLPRVAKDEDGDTVGEMTTEGPLAIHGVYLDHRGDSLRKFFGKEKYEEWTFTAELITPPVTAPDRPLPRISAEWLGKSFPDGLSPMSGGGINAPGSPGTPGMPGTPGAPGSPGLPGTPGSELGGARGPRERPTDVDGEAQEAEPPSEDFPDIFTEPEPEDVPDEPVMEDQPPPEEFPEEPPPEEIPVDDRATDE